MAGKIWRGIWEEIVIFVKIDCTMKRFALILAAMLMAVAVMAQNKRSIASVSSDADNYEVFAYDEDGSRGYYLMMENTGYEVNSAVSVNSDLMSLFIYLGSNVNEAAETLKGIVSLYDAPVGDTKKYSGRLGTTLPLGKTCDVKAMVQKKPLTKKTQLSFTFQGDKANMVSWMKKSDAKMLLKFLSSYQKRHPDR